MDLLLEIYFKEIIIKWPPVATAASLPAEIVDTQ